MTHIVCVNLDGIGEGGYRALYAAASAQRRERADRYLHPADRLRCVAAEALLRYGVKQALGRTEFTLDKTEQGKPFLKDAPGFHFNLSHSGSWVTLAWGDSPVGIDVEQVPHMVKEALLRRCFTPEEQDYVLGLPQEREVRFCRIWTRKESYIKYTGTGLGTKLSAFSTLSMEKPVIQTISLAPNYCMSLCAEEADYTLELLPPETFY